MILFFQISNFFLYIFFKKTEKAIPGGRGCVEQKNKGVPKARA
jgi:hypothetical protein